MKTGYQQKLLTSIVVLALVSVGIWTGASAITKAQIVRDGQAAATGTAVNMNGSGLEQPAVVEVASNNIPASSPSGITLQELARFDGKNGQPAYIAVDGVVYDLSNISAWKNGNHHGVTAGQDVTAMFAQSPHAKSILDQAVVVGNLVASRPVVDAVSTASPVASASPTPKPQTAATTTATPNTATGTVRTITLADLAKFNGKNGQPAYIAVSGIVYDVTNVSAWRNGTHKGVVAGQDVTKAFAGSPHAASLLKQLPVIGKIGTVTAAGSLPAATPSASPSPNGQVSDDGDDDDDGGDDDGDDDDDDDD